MAALSRRWRWSTHQDVTRFDRRASPAVGIECVPELALTAERRNELAALLDDEQRLQEEYPKVSEYLDMAPNLAGTGNLQVDAAFDLRFVHYVIDGSESPYPYWDIVAPFVHEQEGRRLVNGGNPEGSA